jgi:hypothetical protein
MAEVCINDNSIWVKNIEAGQKLCDRIMQMKPGDLVDLEVDGIVGKWERMRDGKDGRPTLGIKPVAEMREIWKQMQRRRGEIVKMREVVTADTYLASLSPSLSEWDSPEDEEAYRDL